MTPTALIDMLEAAAPAIEAALRAVPPDLRARRPDASAWSVLEIACHLLDEESDDFRARVRSTLADPSAPWPPIDPEGWVTARNYAARDFEEVVARWREERAASVAWLRSLEAPDWSRSYQHPRIGAIAARDLLASWVAHDALHLRQIAKRAWWAARELAGGAHLEYAGTPP